LPELRDGERHSFVERLSLNMSGVGDPVRICEGDAAAGGGHGEDYSGIFAFCSLRLAGRFKTQNFGLKEVC